MNQPSDPRLASLRAATLAAPDEPALHLLLASALLERRLVEDAEAEYRECLRLSPGSREGLLGLAQALVLRGQLNSAIEQLNEFRKTHDASADECMLRARILFQAGDTQRSVEAYRRAVELNQNLSDPHFDEMLGIGAGGEASIIDGRIRQRVEEPGPSAGLWMERPTITFADIGGMEQVKEEIRRRIIYPMQRPEMYRAYGQSIGGGILLYGPPGCGKTHLARATAGEVQATFFSVGIHEILNMWIGSSERNLHGVFEAARANQPSVVFFDEVDALAASRSDMRTSAGRHLINQFLAEFDGLGKGNEGVLIVGATNAPWHLDSAFRRPGRFDQVIFVPPPDAPARTAILKVLLRDRPVKEIDYERVAEKANGFSGADLRGVVERAITRRLDDALRTGDPQPVDTGDLLKAIAAARPTTVEWLATARNYILYANESGLYDAVRPLLKM